MYTRVISMLPGYLLFTILVPTSANSFTPLTTGFTPAPECTSLTIVHISRFVSIHTGCIGEDPSCCPPTGRANNTYSPGICPTGYDTNDPHVGIDKLGTDTDEWEATCIPRYVILSEIFHLVRASKN